jgi:glycosyltransferase involved in cell wall biosynthesis
VMLEAMVCGTPVIAFPEGSARELVTPGCTGWLVSDEREMAAACALAGEIDPARCRAAIVRRCDVRVVAAAYEGIYLRTVAAAGDLLTGAAAIKIGGDHTGLLERSGAGLVPARA